MIEKLDIVLKRRKRNLQVIFQQSHHPLTVEKIVIAEVFKIQSKKICYFTISIYTGYKKINDIDKFDDTFFDLHPPGHHLMEVVVGELRINS